MAATQRSLLHDVRHSVLLRASAVVGDFLRRFHYCLPLPILFSPDSAAPHSRVASWLLGYSLCPASRLVRMLGRFGSWGTRGEECALPVAPQPHEESNIELEQLSIT